jgi:hypothetical protein
VSEYRNPWQEIDTRELDADEGIVKTWFASNGHGALATRDHGEARVTWHAVPPRVASPNGKRYLVPGEKVKVKFFGKPHERKAGVYSQARKSEKFTVQAYGVTIPGDTVGQMAISTEEAPA